MITPRPSQRAFTITEVMVASSITLALGFLLIQAFMLFDHKKNELKFETNSSMAVTRLFQQTSEMCQEASGDGFTWDASRQLLLLQRVVKVDTHGTQEWANDLFAVKFEPAKRELYWGDMPLRAIAVDHTPKLPASLDEQALERAAAVLVDAKEQRERLVEVNSFEVTQPSSSSLQMRVALENTKRKETNDLTRTDEFTRQRLFYLSSSGPNAGQP